MNLCIYFWLAQLHIFDPTICWYLLSDSLILCIPFEMMCLAQIYIQNSKESVLQKNEGQGRVSFVSLLTISSGKEWISSVTCTSSVSQFHWPLTTNNATVETGSSRETKIMMFWSFHSITETKEINCGFTRKLSKS